MDELLEAFLIECRELTAQANRDLKGLANAPGDAALLDSAFRAFHTLKGSAAMMGFAPLERLLNAGEDLLSIVRRGDASLGADFLARLTEALDRTEAWLDVVEASGALPVDAPAVGEALATRLAGLLQPQTDQPETSAPDEWAAALAHRSGREGRLTAFRYAPDPECFFRGEDPLLLVRSVPGLAALEITPREPWGPPELYDPFRCNLVFEGLSSAPPAEVRAALRLAADQAQVVEITSAAAPAAARPEREAAAAGPTRTLRVDAERVDALASVLDDLIIAKNSLGRLVQARAGSGDRELSDAQARLDRLVAELHASVTRVRLVPLGPLLGRFPRLVRDAASSLGKRVAFGVEGEDVEVDKAVADALHEPLLHVLRNAVDHGLEPPDDRAAAGKPPEGRVALRAAAAGDQVVIEVTDDGRGMDPEQIRRVAVARGVRSADQAAALSEAEVLDLVFTPGFSTAAQVGSLSGRGVGMDAVRTAAAALGGGVSLESRVGQGTTVRLSLPATVVLTRLMVVAAGRERFGVPLDQVVETARVPRERLVPIRAGQAFVLRDRAVPMLHLADLLGFETAGHAADLKILAVRSGADVVGVAVDALVDRFDAPVRPTSGLLAGMPGVLGTTLTGDGEVLMVLDLPELIG